MTLLTVVGVFSLVFGFLFLVSPGTITKMAEWSNRMISRTDDFVIARKKPAGIFLVLAGLFILGMVFLR